MKSLTKDQIEEIEEIYEFGYFMKHVLDKKTDYVYESQECEMCGSHGSVRATIGGIEVTLKEW